MFCGQHHSCVARGARGVTGGGWPTTPHPSLAPDAAALPLPALLGLPPSPAEPQATRSSSVGSGQTQQFLLELFVAERPFCPERKVSALENHQARKQGKFLPLAVLRTFHGRVSASDIGFWSVTMIRPLSCSLPARGLCSRVSLWAQPFVTGTDLKLCVQTHGLLPESMGPHNCLT